MCWLFLIQFALVVRCLLSLGLLLILGKTLFLEFTFSWPFSLDSLRVVGKLAIGEGFDPADFERSEVMILLIDLLLLFVSFLAC